VLTIYTKQRVLYTLRCVAWNRVSTCDDTPPNASATAPEALPCDARYQRWTLYTYRGWITEISTLEMEGHCDKNNHTTDQTLLNNHSTISDVYETTHSCCCDFVWLFFLM
jgi:hypothetical protein